MKTIKIKKKKIERISKQLGVDNGFKKKKGKGRLVGMDVRKRWGW